MNISQNFHPTGQWLAMIASLWGKEGGSCIHLTLSDENGSVDLAFHYGREENREEFVAMFKEAISKLP